MANPIRGFIFTKNNTSKTFNTGGAAYDGNAGIVQLGDGAVVKSAMTITINAKSAEGEGTEQRELRAISYEKNGKQHTLFIDVDKNNLTIAAGGTAQNFNELENQTRTRLANNKFKPREVESGFAQAYHNTVNAYIDSHAEIKELPRMSAAKREEKRNEVVDKFGIARLRNEGDTTESERKQETERAQQAQKEIAANHKRRSEVRARQQALEAVRQHTRSYTPSQLTSEDIKPHGEQTYTARLTEPVTRDGRTYHYATVTQSGRLVLAWENNADGRVPVSENRVIDADIVRYAPLLLPSAFQHDREGDWRVQSYDDYTALSGHGNPSHPRSTHTRHAHNNTPHETQNRYESALLDPEKTSNTYRLFDLDNNGVLSGLEFKRATQTYGINPKVLEYVEMQHGLSPRNIKPSHATKKTLTP